MHGFKPFTVVIRFQICIFDILNTAIARKPARLTAL